MQGIRSCRVDRDLFVGSVYFKINLCAVRFSDPVSLHLLYFLRPVKLVKICKQTIRVCCDLEHPLF